MDNNDVLKIIEETETIISNQAIKNNGDLNYLLRSVISFILEGIEIAGESELDIENMKEFVLKRYIYSIPFRANWTLRMITSGFYSSGYSLLRILFEEIISLEYFLANPNVAKSAFLQDSYIEPSMRKKLSALGFKDDHFFKIIYKELSEDFVHPKLKKSRVLITGSNEATPEPFYHQESVEKSLKFLLFLIANALFRMFQLDINNKNWKKHTELLLNDCAFILDQNINFSLT